MIEEGNMVIVRLHDDKSTMMVRASGDHKFFKEQISVRNLIGAPFGSVFQINGRQLDRVADESLFDQEDFMSDGKEEQADVPSSSSSSSGGSNQALSRGDNRNINDFNTAQKLKDSDIHLLREAGASGLDIIKSLIANSDTWSTKSEFAQEKWLKRKQKKYIRRMRVVKSTPATLCEVYHSKNREKICNLRPDSLAQVLSQSGVRAGSRVLVVESIIGLMVGSVAYRLRGFGRILAMYSGQQPHFELVDALNLDEKSTKIIQPIPCNELGPAANCIRENGFADPSLYLAECKAQEEASQSEREELAAVATMTHEEPASSSVSDGGKETEEEERRATTAPTRHWNKSGRSLQDLMRSRAYLREGVDSLIIASKFYPLPILKEAIVLLTPSSPFVIFSEFVEPLVECYLYLHQNSLAVRLVLSDTWMREFQTLPGRVHPQMYMSSSSGYLLTGIFLGTNAGTIHENPSEDTSALPTVSNKRARTEEGREGRCDGWNGR